MMINQNMQMFMNMLRNGGNPQQLVLNMLQSQPNNKIFNNLYQMAQAGKTKDIESFARNICKEQNVNFDQEFQSFKQMFGIK